MGAARVAREPFQQNRRAGCIQQAAAGMITNKPEKKAVRVPATVNEEWERAAAVVVCSVSVRQCCTKPQEQAGVAQNAREGTQSASTR